MLRPQLCNELESREESGDWSSHLVRLGSGTLYSTQMWPFPTPVQGLPCFLQRAPLLQGNLLLL